MSASREQARRKIAVVTGGRAEYGLLVWLMRCLKANPNVELQIIATGSHLSPEFGLTYQAIEADGFRLAAKVEMLLSSDSPCGITKATGLGMIGFADCFANLQPDIVVVLGDRFEIMAAAQAAMLANIPLAHVHGGEVTEGAVDESIRHAITKMAQVHFVSAEPYRKRVIQMGEQPDRVFCVGAPGLDALAQMPFLTRDELEVSLDLSFDRPVFLVTYHPVTLSEQSPEVSLKALFSALDHFPQARVIFTKSNADAHGRIIGRMIDDYAALDPKRIKAYMSLGQSRYLSAMRQAHAVIGNSSSGIIEAPAFGVPTVNIGDRQKGRLRADSIFDCAEASESVIKAIEAALKRGVRPPGVTPYGVGGVAPKIGRVLQEIELSGLCIKPFYDLPS